MAEPVFFKSQTFGGFNKEDVLKYIDFLNAESFAKQQEAEEEISAKEKELAEKSEKLDDIQSKYDEIMAAYEELRQHYLMLKEHSDNIDAENEKLKERCEIAEKELCIEKELNRQLEERVANDKQKEDEIYLRERRLSASVESAADSAKMMLATAKNGAQSIIDEAQSSADSVNAEIDAFKVELEKTKSFMEDSLAVLSQRLEYIGKTADSAKISSEGRTAKLAEIQTKYEELVAENENRAELLKKRFFQ